MGQKLATRETPFGATAKMAMLRTMSVARALSAVAVLILAAFALRVAAVAQPSPDDLAALNRQISQLHQSGKYAEGTALAEQYVALARQRHGEEHLEFATALSWLGRLYGAQGRFGEAEPLLERAQAIREKAHGSDHPDVADSLNDLAGLYHSQGRDGEAEALLRRALVIAERTLGPDNPTVGELLNNLGEIHRDQSRYGEAESVYKRALAIREGALGSNHPDVATSLIGLAELYRVQGRYVEAEPLLNRGLTIQEKAIGPDHPDVGQSLNNLAALYVAQGRYGEAEPLYKRALAITEKAVGAHHPALAVLLSNLALLYRDQGREGEAEPLLKRTLSIMEKALGPDDAYVGQGLNNLAGLYYAQGRYAEAEPLFARALAISEKALGPDHPNVATPLNNLGLLYGSQGRYGEAEPVYKRALAIRERALGPNHPDVGLSLNNLAELYRAQGRYGEAEPLFERAIAIFETALGSDHSNVGASLNNLAEVYRAEGRYDEAEPLYNRALVIWEKAFGPDHPNIGLALNNLGLLNFLQRRWASAAAFWRRSTSVTAKRAQRGTLDVGQPLTGKRRSEAEQLSWQFLGLVKVAYRLASDDHPNLDQRLRREMFQTAQWAQSSEAAQTLLQMAARGAKGDPRLARLVRERQDLVAEWQKRDAARSASVAQAPDKRDAQADAANVARLSAIDTRIGDIDRRLAEEFPDYAAMVNPAPLSIGDVQALLGSDEALVLFLDTPEWKPVPEETFIWVVTKREIRWVRSELGTPSLRREVAALRCGLDYDGAWSTTDSPCTELLKTDYTAADHRVGKPLPFDPGRAGALYKALFGGVEDVIKGKHLLIVASGALTQLPFQVLITRKHHPGQSTPKALQRAAWLVRSHALTVLPSVSSLKALRQLAKESHASRSLMGFGNPLLDGPDARYTTWAGAARSKQSCPKAPEQRLATLAGERRDVLPLGLRGGLADVAQIRSQVPLPETADELCAVARDLGVSSEVIQLGERATETEIKRLSDAGELAKYRVIHFATHGALAGQISGNAEPGLILTPPTEATETDDGYLSASEITALKLDADWVILSACNTAAGGAEGTEALSGLARAFFYAGARSLLVSHWSVYSDSTVKLITDAVRRMAADKTIGRAQAMRQSMLAMIDKGRPYEAHPAYWAPFVVVGEGGAAR
jgi:CHAT domain-containing protein/Tfp pilus assembly protein PilF